MHDQQKTKLQLMQEVESLRRQLADQSALEAKLREATELAGLIDKLRQELIEHKQAQADLKMQEERMRLLYKITSQVSKDVNQQLTEALTLATRLLGLEIGMIGRIEAETYIVQHFYGVGRDLKRGKRVNLAQICCSLTWQTDRVVVIDQPGPLSQPGYGGNPPTAYIGSVIFVKGEPYGTLSFSSSIARKSPFGPAERDFIEMLGRWVGSAIERKQDELALLQYAAGLEVAHEQAAVIRC